MAYKVIATFADLHDDGHIYNVGDEFPRAGVIVNQNRIDELAGDSNKLGKPLIESVFDGMNEPTGEAEAVKKPTKKKSSKK